MEWCNSTSTSEECFWMVARMAWSACCFSASSFAASLGSEVIGAVVSGVGFAGLGFASWPAVDCVKAIALAAWKAPTRTTTAHTNTHTHTLSLSVLLSLCLCQFVCLSVYLSLCLCVCVSRPLDLSLSTLLCLCLLFLIVHFALRNTRYNTNRQHKAQSQPHFPLWDSPLVSLFSNLGGLCWLQTNQKHFVFISPFSLDLSRPLSTSLDLSTSRPLDLSPLFLSPLLSLSSLPPLSPLLSPHYQHTHEQCQVLHTINKREEDSM